MTFYYLFIVFTLSFGWFYERFDDTVKRIADIIYIVFFTILFGLRHEVGADWSGYLRIYNDSIYYDFFNTFEIGYRSLNVFANYYDLSIYFVNLSSSFILIYLSIYGLKKLGLNPYFVLAVISPYHYVMSGVNYTRQSIGLSAIIYSLHYLINNNTSKYIRTIFIAATFHKSILIFIGMSFARFKYRYLIPLAVLFFVPSIALMISEYRSQYIDRETFDSAGFILRFGFIIVVNLLLILNFKNLKLLDELERKLVWIIFSSLIMLPAIYILSSTMADRISYYFLIISSVIYFFLLSKYRLPYSRIIYTILFVTSMTAMSVWIAYGTMWKAYVYDNLLFLL